MCMTEVKAVTGTPSVSVAAIRFRVPDSNVPYIMVIHNLYRINQTKHTHYTVSDEAN